jgi:hypothetical protein
MPFSCLVVYHMDMKVSIGQVYMLLAPEAIIPEIWDCFFPPLYLYFERSIPDALDDRNT